MSKKEQKVIQDPFSDFYKISFVFLAPKERGPLEGRIILRESKKGNIKRINLKEIPESITLESLGKYRSFQGKYTVTLDREERNIYTNRFERGEEIPVGKSLVLEGILQKVYNQ